MASTRMRLTQLDDRRVLGRALQVDDVDVSSSLLGDLDVSSSNSAIMSSRWLPSRVVALDRVADGRLGGDHHLDVVAGEELEVVDGVDVRRVGHRHDQRGAGAVDRDDLVLLATSLGTSLMTSGSISNSRG
jgi:hypothetical protein